MLRTPPGLREPSSWPRATSTRAEVETALLEASRFVRAGGRWSLTLVRYVDGWLDHAIARRFRLRQMNEDE